MPRLFSPGTKQYQPYIQNALDEINPDYPNPERHRLSDEAHCMNPKCDYQLDDAAMQEARANHGFICPKCGFDNKFDTNQTELLPFERREQWERGDKGSRQPGLSVGELGKIGEEVVVRMHELPKVGVISWYHDGGVGSTFPIDVIVTNDLGRYGCEIKTASSDAQPVFPMGSRKERMDKINYCYAHGLKPAIICVRLNFYNNLANIFFREGITTTAIGNKQMHLIATVNFEDLNPFKSPDPEAQALAVQNANIPDYGDSDLDAAFGPATASIKVTDNEFEKDHPRKKDGEFTFKHDVHELKVKDKHGKTKEHLRHCVHCGVLYAKPEGFKGRMECPTCGEDPERRLHAVSRTAARDNLDQMAKSMGWTPIGPNRNGHRQYEWMDDKTGVSHLIVASGTHTRKPEEDANYFRQRSRKCMSGQCAHRSSTIVPQVVEPGQPMFRKGQTVKVNNDEYIIVDIEGGLALVQNVRTGIEDIFPADVFRAASEKDPDYMWIYYMGSLRVEKYHHNKKFERMFKDLLDAYGVDIEKTMMDIDPTEVAAGEIYEFSDGSIRVDHKQLAREEVRENADVALGDWIREKGEVFDSSEWQDAD